MTSTAKTPAQLFALKLYRSGYWQAARRLPAAKFGPGSVCLDGYMKGFVAGSAAIAKGRAQRAMVWSTERWAKEKGLAAEARREARERVA